MLFSFGASSLCEALLRAVCSVTPPTTTTSTTSSLWVFSLAQHEEFKVRLQRQSSDSAVLNWIFFILFFFLSGHHSWTRRVSQRESAGVFIFFVQSCKTSVFFFPPTTQNGLRVFPLPRQKKKQRCQSDWIIILVSVTGFRKSIIKKKRRKQELAPVLLLSAFNDLKSEISEARSHSSDIALRGQKHEDTQRLKLWINWLQPTKC